MTHDFKAAKLWFDRTKLSWGHPDKNFMADIPEDVEAAVEAALTAQLTANEAPAEDVRWTYNARNHLLALTDPTNWDSEMKGEFYNGYKEAMETLHESVMDFWDELSKATLPRAAYRKGETK